MTKTIRTQVTYSSLHREMLAGRHKLGHQMSRQPLKLPEKDSRKHHVFWKEKPPAGKRTAKQYVENLEEQMLKEKHAAAEKQEDPSPEIAEEVEATREELTPS